MSKRSVKPYVVNLISLGCAKNEVDSERILGKLVEGGFAIAEDPADADLCLVNTCGFIHDAREESAGVLRQISALKKGGKLKAVAAMGCLVERAAGAPELVEFLDAADARIGFLDYPRMVEICRDLCARAPSVQPASTSAVVGLGDQRFRGLAASQSFSASYAEFLTAPRLRIGSPHLAHLKISEGCSNFCKFCSIPSIRGIQVSRPMNDIVTETRQLIDMGAQEISLIAQDTSSYGRDLYKRLALPELLRALAEIKADVWFRLMYAFPRFLNDEMLDVLASDPRFCPYIDIPLQHITDSMLAAMGRGMLQRETVALLDRIKTKLPSGSIRTTFIVGHPGETRQDFDALVAFVEEGRFSHVGAFLYSAEPRTPSAKLTDDVPMAEKKRRRDVLMKAQLDVSRRLLKKRVGGVEDVLIDGPVPSGTTAPKGARWIARSQREAADVDGSIFVTGQKKLTPGQRLSVQITGALDYDLLALALPVCVKRKR